jgi:hypothetical protein
METLIQNHYPHELAKPHWQEAAGYLVRTATGEWDTLICKAKAAIGYERGASKIRFAKGSKEANAFLIS